ncbi:uncharacterized protein N7482_009147 [Penicillium canariense]|uniref:Zn(2)-C6 fungal-type domain-containing protein n=1 Tax=Penicillium canariense TaxID=189055 RepID=A0A9W9HSH9_9EURO|nr:uncharacterized protein N7482_009147 [Penicillium canariense]KAJ5152669.1 hypothetical protein N7482_009147 [Penicillium canariense]
MRAPSRKKACQECTASKVRCTHEKPACVRCRDRGKQCRYTGDRAYNAQDGSSATSSNPDTSAANSVCNFSTPGPSVGFISPQSPGIFNLHVSPTPQNTFIQTAAHKMNLEFENISLHPMLHAEEIRDRWLRPYVMTATGQVPKLFHPFTVQYLTCVLRSYPNHLLDGNSMPPFIHPMQLARQPIPPALANCSSLVRMWMNRAPGSEGLVFSTVKREMDRLIAETPIIGDFDLLCSFQALLIYMLMAYFFPIDDTSLLEDNDIIALQEIAFYSAKRGLACEAEVSRTRPSWECWIVASAKRRTVLTMYLFTSIYNASKGLPNFVAEELKEVLVPESKALWQASDRASWTTKYDRHLSKWEDGMLTLSELWRSPETGSETRRERIERWVQSADEFGMMLFAVCAHLHGC